MGHRWAVALLGLALVLAAGAARSNHAQRHKDASEIAQAPQSVAAMRNPYQGQATAVSAGRKLYRRHCAECHDADSRGQRHAPDLQSAEVQGASPGALFWVLRNGDIRDGMPSWSRLPDERLWQIVTYLQKPREQQPQR